MKNHIDTSLRLTVALHGILLAASAPALDCTRLDFNNPGETTFLNVGLWAHPMAMDYDCDGDLDLVVGCHGVPCAGTYFFENASPKGSGEKMPVFRPGRRIEGGRKNMTLTSYRGVPVVTVGNGYVTDFPRGGFRQIKPFIGAPKNVHTNAVRGDCWRLADFDGDGREDLVVGIGDWTPYYTFNAAKQKECYAPDGTWLTSPVDGLVYWCRNLGGASVDEAFFSDKAELVRLADGSPMWVNGNPMPMAEDWDGDGDLDIVCGEFVDGFTYFENVGTKTAPKYAAGRRLVASDGRELKMALAMITPSAVDWDGDGDLDIICGDEDGRVAFIENTGRRAKGMPVFEQPRYFRQEADQLSFGCLSTPWGVDWDGDGDTDLLAGDSLGHIAFIENLSGAGAATPKWAEPKLLESGGRPIHIQAGEKGSIQGPIERKWGYTVLSAADWDGDGLPDVMVNSILGDVVWFRNVGTRTKPALAPMEDVVVEWEGPQPELAFGWYKPKHKKNPNGLLTQWRTTPVMLDWNRDGLMDLVMLDHEGYLALFERARKNGRLVLLPPKRVFAWEDGTLLRLNPRLHGASGRRKFCFCDWDGDGRLDLVLNSRNAELWLQVGTENGITRFRKPRLLSGVTLAGHTCAPTSVDFDGDGVPDLVVGAEDGYFYYLRNPRSGK